MAGRRTNLALFGALALAFITGVLAFAIGTQANETMVVAHGIAGFIIVVLTPWKSLVARRGLTRPRRSGKGASLAFTVLVVVAIATGVLHSTGVATSFGPVDAMQVHVGAALVSLPLALWHVVARRVRIRRGDLSRRQVIRAGAVVGAGAIVYVVLEGAMRVARLSGADRRFTGSHETGSFDPTAMPVTQWLDDDVPAIDAAGWHLRIGDSNYGYDDIARFSDRTRAVLDCTGGWFAEQEWEGVWLDRLLDGRDGRSIAVGSATGYGRRFPMSDVDRLFLATRVGGAPLSPGHGFPARIVAPGRRGFWWVKWVTSIDVDDRPWWVQWPFPPT